jgi:hypothetical protein
MLIASRGVWYISGYYWTFSGRFPENPAQISEHFKTYSSQPERFFTIIYGMVINP